LVVAINVQRNFVKLLPMLSLTGKALDRCAFAFGGHRLFDRRRQLFSADFLLLGSSADKQYSQGQQRGKNFHVELHSVHPFARVTVSRLNIAYTVGVTTSENRSAIVSPPITPIASGCSNSEPAPKANARGNIPSIAASEVISTGRKRRRPDRSNASRN